MLQFSYIEGEKCFSEFQRPPPRSACLYPRALVLLFSEKPRFLFFFFHTGRDFRQIPCSRRETNAERGRAAMGASRAVGEHVLRFITEEKSHSFSTLARSRYEQVRCLSSVHSHFTLPRANFTFSTLKTRFNKPFHFAGRPYESAAWTHNLDFTHFFF